MEHFDSPENVGGCFLCGSGCSVEENPIDLWSGLNESVYVMEDKFIDIRITHSVTKHPSKLVNSAVSRAFGWPLWETSML